MSFYAFSLLLPHPSSSCLSPQPSPTCIKQSFKKNTPFGVPELKCLMLGSMEWVRLSRMLGHWYSRDTIPPPPTFFMQAIYQTCCYKCFMMGSFSGLCCIILRQHQCLGQGLTGKKKPSGKCFSCSRMWARLWCWVGMGGRGGKSNAEMKRWNRGAITKPLSFCVTPSAPPVAHSCIPPTLCIFRRSLGWICILQKTLNTAWYWGFTYNSVSCFLSHSICHL